MRLLIIRHGESEADLLNVHEGRADFALTKSGMIQAEKMARWVADRYTIDRIYSSPMKRTRQTANFLAREVRLTAELAEELMEFNNGLLAGKSRKEVREQFPLVPNLPIHASVYEQESKLDFRYRAECILSKILSENAPDATIAAITHGGTINQLYRAFLRLPIDAPFFWSTGDTGIHEWTVNGEARRIIRSNSLLHLE